jgi:hypothetical protein
MSIVKNYTWPVCIGCRHRVLRRAYSMYIDVSSGEHREFCEAAYVCELGLDRGRSPDTCPHREPEQH